MKTEKHNTQSLQLNCDQPKHTQGEWKLNLQDLIIYSTKEYRGENNEPCIAEIKTEDCCSIQLGISENEAIANAQRIVKCCNDEWKIDMHDELVETLKQCSGGIYPKLADKIQQLLQQAEQK